MAVGERDYFCLPHTVAVAWVIAREELLNRLVTWQELGSGILLISGHHFNNPCVFWEGRGKLAAGTDHGWLLIGCDC